MDTRALQFTGDNELPLIQAARDPFRLVTHSARAYVRASFSSRHRRKSTIHAFGAPA